MSEPKIPKAPKAPKPPKADKAAAVAKHNKAVADEKKAKVAEATQAVADSTTDSRKDRQRKAAELLKKNPALESRAARVARSA